MSTDDLIRALAAVYSPAQLELMLPYFTTRAVDAANTRRRDQAELLTQLGDQFAAAYALADHRAAAPAPAAAGQDRPVTPTELNDLGARARRLATAVNAVHDRLRAAPDEPTRRAGFRLDDAAGEIRHAAVEVEATATDLWRVINRSECPADWGACPDHGGTLASTGGRSWCTHARCGRNWPYDRLGLPCTEPAAFDVRDAEGDGGPMCAGHATDARRRIIGVVITPLPTTPTKGAPARG